MLLFTRRKALDESLSFRFVLPVVLENAFTIFIGLAVSQVVSTISASALAAIGMATSLVAVPTGFLGMIGTGAGIMVARHVGAGEYKEAAEATEQATLLSMVVTTLVMIACLVGAEPLLRLTMPTAEDALFGEAERYFTLMMCSLPFQILSGTFGSICRGLGNSRVPMATALVTNVCQLVFSWIFVNGLGWNEVGAGLACLLCRAAGAAFIFVALLRDHQYFRLRLRNMLVVHGQTWLRMLRVGIPVGMESTFTQLGYMLANSMAISLGTFAGSVNQIVNTFNSFTVFPQAICIYVAMSAVGHLLGAKRYEDARKAGRHIWMIGMIASLALGVPVCLFGEQLCRIYSSDPETIRACARVLWWLIPVNLAGVTVNCFDPQLRAGGDVNYVMVVTLTAVWLIRLPLTYLFCFVLDVGVAGIFMANLVALTYRSVLGGIRVWGTKWMYKKV